MGSLHITKWDSQVGPSNDKLCGESSGFELDDCAKRESERVRAKMLPPEMLEEHGKAVGGRGRIRETHALTLLGAFLVQDSISTLATNDNISRT